GGARRPSGDIQAGRPRRHVPRSDPPVYGASRRKGPTGNGAGGHRQVTQRRADQGNGSVGQTVAALITPPRERISAQETTKRRGRRGGMCAAPPAALGTTPRSL